jgi:hypothetical protein
MRDDVKLVEEQLMSWSQVVYKQRFLMRIKGVLPFLLLMAPDMQSYVP